MRNRIVQTKKKISRFSLIWFSRALLFFSKLLPYRFGVKLGGLCGLLAFYVFPRERRRALDHLTSVFTNKTPKWIRGNAKRNFVHLGKAMLEFPLMTPQQLARVVQVNGYENLSRALAQGRGVVYVTGHMGNWEIMAAIVGSRYPLSVIAAPLKPRQVNDIVLQLRAAKGVRTILRGMPGASRELIRIFRENRILGLLIDQDTDVEGTFVPFMGKPAWTPTAAASIALKFNAPVVFGYIQRDRQDKHIITIEGPLQLIRTGHLEADIRENTAMLTKKIEKCILSNPEQWVWMHRRWRRQPCAS